MDKPDPAVCDVIFISAKVVLSDVNLAPVQALVEEIQSKGGYVDCSSHRPSLAHFADCRTIEQHRYIYQV